MRQYCWRRDFWWNMVLEPNPIKRCLLCNRRASQVSSTEFVGTVDSVLGFNTVFMLSREFVGTVDSVLGFNTVFMLSREFVGRVDSVLGFNTALIPSLPQKMTATLS